MKKPSLFMPLEKDTTEATGQILFLRKCYHALKQSMVHNFKFLEFYKDLQKYLQDTYFQDQPDSVHLTKINQLINEEHRLDTLQINTDSLEQVRDEAEQTLKKSSKEIELLLQQAPSQKTSLLQVAA
jgi:hypothetical protein